MIWTVDTWVLVGANESLDKSQLECLGFLEHVLNEHTMAISPETLSEYNLKALRNKKSFAAIWYGKIMSTGKVKFFPGEGDNKAAELRQRLLSGLPKTVKRFDRSDVPFVVLSFRTEDKHLISGDIGEGDFSPALTRWLRKEYQICFHELQSDSPYHVARHQCTRAVGKKLN